MVAVCVEFRSVNLLSCAIITSYRYFSKTPASPRIKWTEQQLQILNAVSSGKSVFITGSAGTGRTVLLKHIIRRLHSLYNPYNVFVTASTGAAACALTGQSLHSFAGIGFGDGDGDRQTLLDKVFSDEKAYLRWNDARALVIDEISMVDAECFDNLEYIARMVREEEHDSESTVWGGIQLVVSGDFFQLPPIIKKKKLREKVFAFEADSWNPSFDLQVELANVFRQSEVQLVKLLHNIRKGESDPEDLQLLNKCCSEAEADSSFTQIYPMRKDVDRVNRKKLDELGRSCYVYSAVDLGQDPWKKQLKQGIAPGELILCEGARVMLTKNLDPERKLVNSATGLVTEFFTPDDMGCADICKEDVLPLVKFDSGQELIIYPKTWELKEGHKVVAQRKQLPLILAWALSIHKCQGMTIDRLHTDLSRSFVFGMVYVALSRVKSFDGLHVSGFDPLKIWAHPKVIQFYLGFSGKQDEQGEDEGVNKSTSSRILCFQEQK